MQQNQSTYPLRVSDSYDRLVSHTITEKETLCQLSIGGHEIFGGEA